MSVLKSLGAAALLALSVGAQAQVAGGVVLGVTETVNAVVTKGWSAKKGILGKDVYNDATPKNEKVGEIEDLIVSPDGSVSYAIVNSSKYLGLSSHIVAVPVAQFKVVGDKHMFVLPGATKDALRALPKFQYAK